MNWFSSDRVFGFGTHCADNDRKKPDPVHSEREEKEEESSGQTLAPSRASKLRRLNRIVNLNVLADMLAFGRVEDEMASFRDPATTFSPTEVVERLLQITEFYGHSAMLYISSSDDLATYLDSFGFDIYSLTLRTSSAFSTASSSVLVMPNGNRIHERATAH
jgi:hypothetical protein